jgi:prepilin-type N-terminal cleavage/methylation domain-containing protein
MKNNFAHPITVRQQRRRGFTLTEIAIVLGIVGLILGAIWVAAAAVYNNLRTSHANTEVLQIAQAVRSLYATTGTISGAPTAAEFTDSLVCAKAVPADMIATACGAGTLVDPWANGATTVTPDTDGAGFVISMTNVPEANCVGLIMAVAGSGRDPGLFYAEGTAAAPGAMATLTPFTPDEIATPAAAIAGAGGTIANFGGCSAVGSTGAVAFGFTLK